MPMSTTLFGIAPEALAELESSPDTIDKLTSETMFDTYLWTTIPYFLSGGEDDLEDEEEDEDGDEEEDGAGHPLEPVLIGTRSVPCKRLENGAFHVVPAEVARELATLLAEVDLAELEAAVLEAELEEIYDGEVWEELEMLDLTEPEEVAKAVVQDLMGLTAFYAAAAQKGLAVVLYTT